MLTNQCDIIERDNIEGQICGFGIAAESSVGNYILDLLRPLGITERYFGVRQLIQAVEMVMENPDIPCLAKRGLRCDCSAVFCELGSG